MALVSGIIAGTVIRIHPLAGWLLSLCLMILLLLVHRHYRYDFLILFGTMAWLLYFMTGLSVFNTCNRKPVFYDHGVFYSTVMEIPVEKKNSVQTILKLQFIKDGKNFVQTDEKISAMF